MYIEHNLGNISVEDVARETGYSYYHLTRMFTAVLGESIGSYIQKRRLVDSAQKLLYTDKRVIDIAMKMDLNHPKHSAELSNHRIKLVR
jgi:AraC family transcriptional regulator